MNNRFDFDNYNYQDMNMLNEMILNNIGQQTNINNTNKNNNLAGSYEGYIRGNLFNNLYDQYKNYRPAKLIPTNEQAELLLNVNQTTFAAHDIKLYLDTNPNDREMINMFNKYQQQAQDAIKEYERRFGPILADSLSDGNMFSWETYSWPWEMEEM